MLEEGDYLVDRVLHAEEFVEGRIAANHPIAEDPAEARIVASVDQLGFADRGEHAFGSAGVGCRIAPAQFQVFLDAEFFALGRRIAGSELLEKRRHARPPSRSTIGPCNGPTL